MQHEQHRVAVTALAFWSRNVILSGEGTFLKAYDTDRKTLLATVPVFESQAIHGIIVAERDPAHAVVWGGQYVCRVNLLWNPTGQLEMRVGSKLEANDWILNASISNSLDNGLPRVALVTAHNALQLLCLNDEEAEEVKPLVPGSNCILYCAHIRWLSGSQCLIASGTAFGDVIIWSCVIEEFGGKFSVQHQTHYTFSAHEGSVFGVQLSSSEVAGRLEGRQRVLATCSDDRTIRLWDISDLSVRSSTLTEQQRETGFGSTESNGTHAPPALAKVMGHISRIWHVRFEQSNTTRDAYVLSFGEDASNLIWRITASAASSSALPYALQQIGMNRAHNGKNLWSLAMKSSRIATGGADGAISVQHCSSGSTERQASPSDVETPGADPTEMGIFRAYGFVDSSQFLASTDRGSLYLVSLDEGDPNYTKISDPIAGLRGYSIMTSLADLAFVAGSDGMVYMYQHGSRTTSVVAKTDRKVAGLFAHVSSTHPNRIRLLVTNMGRNTAFRYHTDGLDCHDRAGISLQELHLPTGFVVTSFASADVSGHECVFLGSRNGSVALVDPSNNSANDQSPHFQQCNSVHAGETVTRLCIAYDVATEGRMFLLSTGRDGTYAVHEVTLSDSQLRMTTVHQLSLPFGPNVEGLGFSTSGHLWVWGFRSTQFVVFDIQTQQEVMTVECGGAHRIWSFQAKENGGTFVWTKASRLFHQTQRQLPCQMINAGSHGREIKCTAISPGEPCLIATGAEDTDIKLSVYQDGTFRCRHTLQKHNTGIQHVQWSSDGRYLFSSGGFEEFFVWKITPDIAYIGTGVICESKHPRSGTSDLRIMSFDVQNSTDRGLEDSGNDKAFNITTVYSDSTVRSWLYQTRDRTWILLATGDYLTSCLTQCLQVDAPAKHPNKHNVTRLLTASTDGHIAFWGDANLTEDHVKGLRWNRRHKIHQNAILALVASCNLPDLSLLLITGGDDNGIGITRIRRDEDDQVSCGKKEVSDILSCRTLLISRAHAAAVTALCIVKIEHGGDDVRLWLVSASIDQRVKLWRVEIDLRKDGVDGVEIRLVRTVFTAVADVSSMEVMRLGKGEKGVLVCGVGMDVWKIDDGQLS